MISSSASIARRCLDSTITALICCWGHAPRPPSRSTYRPSADATMKLRSLLGEPLQYLEAHGAVLGLGEELALSEQVVGEERDRLEVQGR